MNYNSMIVDISEQKSSLIKRIEYCEENKILTIYFRKYYTNMLCYENVELNHFQEFYRQKSVGKYYLHYIKPNFSQLKTSKMADKPKTKNEASDKKRFIKISIDTTKINKDFIHVGEKGNYLNVTLMMLPDGELDKFGNLGMVVQDVPKAVYEKNKDAKGEILGNGCEFAWEARSEGTPGSETGKLNDGSINDDLPF